MSTKNTSKRIESIQSHLSPETVSSEAQSLSPFVQGPFTPVTKEINQEECKIVGTIPAELIGGEYIKNGPNTFFMPEPGRPYQWFDGDGMLNAVLIKENSVVFINKWVKTVRLENEKSSGEAIFEFGEIIKGNLDPILKTFNDKGERMGKANTSVLYHSKRLFALEENDKPYHMTLPDLETVGRFDFNGQLKHVFTAHPKVDPKKGELHTFGYELSPNPPCIVKYSVFNPEGKLVSNTHVTIREPLFMHDFAISEKFVIFYDIPARFKFDRIYNQEQPWIHEPDTLSRFGIMPKYSKNGDKDIKWFESPSCMIFHTANAYEEGDEVVLECPRADSYSMEFNGIDDPKVWLYLYQWRFNLKTGKTTERKLTNIRADFPVVNKSYVGVKNRFTFLTTYSSSQDKVPLFDGIAKYDRETGKTQVVKFGENFSGGEVYFHPSENGKAEDDGYLMVFVHDLANNCKSEYRVYDAKTLNPTPILRAFTPQNVATGFHGIFVTKKEVSNAINK